MNWKNILLFPTINFVCSTYAVEPEGNFFFQIHSDPPKLHTLPGFGWDALTDRQTKQVLKFTYNQSKVTDDGKFLIPDGFVSDTIEALSVTCNLIEHWSKLKTQFLDLNTQWNSQLSELNSRFSEDSQKVKYLQSKLDAFTTRLKFSHVSYRVRAPPFVSIDDKLKSKFVYVMRMIAGNETEKAEYLIQTIVRDYGTHYSTTADVGRVLIMDSYLPKKYLQDNDKKNIEENSKESFLKFLGKKSDNYVSDFDKTTLHTDLTMLGKSHFDIDEDTDDVAITYRTGELLTNLITQENFLNESEHLLVAVNQMLNDSIKYYYSKNMRRGCTQQNATNFDYNANLDDGSCKKDKYFFGGTFTTCQQLHNSTEKTDCAIYEEFNELTKQFNCPNGFKDTVIYSEMVPIKYFTSFLNLSTYLCIASLNMSDSKYGYKFGGLFSEDVLNAYTKERRCPELFTQISLFRGKLTLCVANNTKVANFHLLNFGGLVTGMTGMQCPVGYQRRLAVKLLEGEVHFCLEEEKMVGYEFIPLLLRPPFGSVSKNLFQEDSLNTGVFENLDNKSGSGQGKYYVGYIKYILCALAAIVLAGVGICVYAYKGKLNCKK